MRPIKDNYGKPTQDFVNKLQAMTDEQLLKEAEQDIWLSAYAQNNRRSDYHWHADECYEEAKRRNKSEIYTQAFNAARKHTGAN